MTYNINISNERLGRIVEDAASEVYIFSANDFWFRFVNRGARENLGYSNIELTQLTPWELKPKITKDEFIELVKPLISGEIERLDFETVHRRKNGTDYDVAVQLQVFEEAGDCIFYAAIQDITANRRLKHEARSLEKRLDAILNNTTMSVFVMDNKQHCIFMNSAAERLTGYSFDETVGRQLHDVIHHTYPDGTPFPLSECAIDRAFPENAGTQGEEIFVHKDGSFYPVAFTASPIRNEEAKVIGTIIEVRGISEEKRREHASTLLMREVDHRARNMLFIVQSLARLTRADDVKTYREIFKGRLSALARAQTSLANHRWEGGQLEEVVRAEMVALYPAETFDVEGPEVNLPPEQVQPISMLLHELATNASKHGALSVVGGRVSVTWTLAQRLVMLRWCETGGPPVTVPTREGFGSALKSSLVRQIGGTITRSWKPTGLDVEVAFPL